ncbi:hypothetical protein KAFR_0A01620 [Kazachstania africana CBS 2517]|uniref:J domain-containing protein n=1 Tax=Kazachstania africana (strain ATCC 22294 / BCRC 22015 / CBS 2517 / CECT 1963 / NBRC 1671 / NRRL Y-8276) TaxID=1071382 RepID=H2AMK0_KAZAF|nr:hypothetical protein KAFR_0A01620 [Kazachstania africana CBS 2517]CCF55600.1 hypothetical protein KAFR_0A01620 [Kazachstania africana CBS 2517]
MILVHILAVFLVSLPLLSASSSQKSICNPDYLNDLTKSFKLDSAEINKYQNLITKVENNCDTAKEPMLLRFLNQLYYKIGLIQLSNGQDLKAIDIFQKIQNYENGSDNDDYYYLLSKSRLKNLFLEYGMWDKLRNELSDSDEDFTEPIELFNQLNSALVKKLQSSFENPDYYNSLIQDELIPMLNISPYNLDVLSIYIDVLFKLLGSKDSENDLFGIAIRIIKSYDLILQKHKTSISINQRLEIYYSNSVLQMFLLNIDPMHNLKKCLAIDMDYTKCKRLSVFLSKLNKINPSYANFLDPNKFNLEFDNNLDWNRAIEFYLVEKKPFYKLFMPVDSAFKFENNYNFVITKSTELINDVIFNMRPLISHNLPRAESQEVAFENNEFGKFIDLVLCQASQVLENNKLKSLAKSYCKKCLRETLDKDQYAAVSKAINGQETFSIELLNDLWNSYPPLIPYLITLSLSRKSNSNIHVKTENQHIFFKFIKENNLFHSTNPSIKAQVREVEKRLQEEDKLRREQQQHNQHQQQQRQQRWRYQQQNSRQQQQQAPPSNSNMFNKDYYKILGISKEATSKDIRKAYLQLTKRYHPDKQGHLSESEQKKNHEKMSEINEAYETLSDEAKKSEYDSVRSGKSNQNMFRGANPVRNNFMFNQRNPFPPNFKVRFP